MKHLMLLLELLKKLREQVFVVVTLVGKILVTVAVLHIFIVVIIAFISSAPLQVDGEVILVDAANCVVLG